MEAPLKRDPRREISKRVDRFILCHSTETPTSRAPLSTPKCEIAAVLTLSHALLYFGLAKEWSQDEEMFNAKPSC